MATITQKPNIRYVWASLGGKDVPSIDDILEGWIVQIPPHERANWIEFRQDTCLKYLFQEGISEWDSAFEYRENSLVKWGRNVYFADVDNTNKQPDIETEVWTLAFDPAGATDDLRNTVNRILNEEAFLGLYVSKANPVVTGRVAGNGYGAASGVPTTTSGNVGYTFNDKPLTGLAVNSDGEPVIVRNGSVVAQFTPVTSSDESNKKVVTMDILQDYIQIYKINDLYLTTGSENPSERLKYGTWVRHAEGRALVGFSTSISSDVPTWVKQINGTAGEYDVQLQTEHIAPHKHYGVRLQSGGTSDLNSENKVLVSAHRTQSDYNGYIFGGVANTTANEPNSSITSNPVGSNNLTITEAVAHNNVQPSITVFVWRRVG